MGVLLAQSLVAWQIAGRVERAPDGLIVVHGDTREVRIARAPADLPFRWMVTADGRIIKTERTSVRTRQTGKEELHDIERRKTEKPE